MSHEIGKISDRENSASANTTVFIYGKWLKSAEKNIPLKVSLLLKPLKMKLDHYFRHLFA